MKRWLIGGLDNACWPEKDMKRTHYVGMGGKYMQQFAASMARTCKLFPHLEQLCDSPQEQGRSWIHRIFARILQRLMYPRNHHVICLEQRDSQ